MRERSAIYFLSQGDDELAYAQHSFKVGHGSGIELC